MLPNCALIACALLLQDMPNESLLLLQFPRVARK